MFKMALKKLIPLTVCCLAASAISAQTSTQGAIGGTVYDATNAVIPKATVTIHNTGTNANIVVTADDSGYFKAPLVEPGIYTVSVTASGFGGYKADNVIVQVGQFTTLNAHIAAAGAAETVDVSADLPVLNTDSPDFTSNLNQKALEDIPVNNRRWSALALTTPGIVADSSGFGLISVRAMPTTQNNVEIDGADDNNAYYAEERGRTREAYSTSENAVREFAVNSGVYSAEYGRAAGAMINSVTKSGTNQIHGALYFYDRESNWNAFQEYSKVTNANYTAGNPIPTSFTTSPFKPEDVRKIYGFTVGGPIIKDKLFWMYTYDQHTRIFPAIDIPGSPATFYTLPDAVQPAGTTCTATGYMAGASAVDQVACTLAARLAAGGVAPLSGAASGSYAAGYNAYVAGIAGNGNQLGILSELGYEPREGYQEINTPKLTWQVNSKNQVNLLYHRLRWDSPGGVQTASILGYGVDTTGNDFVKLDYGVAKLSTQVSGTLSNEVLFQYGHELLPETQQPFSAYTKQNLTAASGNVPEVDLLNYSGGTGFYMGSPYYSYRPANPSEWKWQIEDTMYKSWGNHSLKFGADVLHNEDFNNALNQTNPPAGGNGTSANGMYYYKYYGNYLADLYSKSSATPVCDANHVQVATATATAVGNYECYATSGYGQAFGNPKLDIQTLDWALFAQDNWKISPRLTLEIGLRFDQEVLPALPAALANNTGATAIPQTAQKPGNGINFGPRIGFSYDVYGSGKTILRGGYGMYYGRITNGVLLGVLDDTGSLAGQYLGYTSPISATAANAASAPRFPNNIVAAGSTAIPAAYYLSTSLKVPEIHEIDLQVQQDMGHGNVFAVSYMGALGRRLDNFLNTNLNPNTVANETITVSDSGHIGPLPAGSVFTVPVFTSYNNPNYTNITGVYSNINSVYNALVAEFQNRSLKHVQFDINYTFSHALDYGTNSTTVTAVNSWINPYASQRANYGNSSYNVPNRLNFYVLYTLPNFVGQSSFLHYLTNGWNVDTSFQAQNGLPISLGDSGTLSYSSGGVTTGAITSGLYGSGFTTYLPMIGRNTYHYPTHWVDDAKISKDIPFTEKYNLTLMLQVFNVANKQNIDGYSSTSGYTLAGNGVGTGTATWNTSFLVPSSSNNSGFLYTPRELEIAAKFHF